VLADAGDARAIRPGPEGGEELMDLYITGLLTGLAAGMALGVIMSVRTTIRAIDAWFVKRVTLLPGDKGDTDPADWWKGGGE